MSEAKELTVPERAAVALGAPEHEKKLIELSKKYADIKTIANSAGREQVHSAYMELKNTRVAIVNAGKKAREDANAFQTAVIAEVTRLTAITADEETRLQTLRDDFDAEREREKQAKAAAEKSRVDGIRQSIDGLRAYAANAVGKTSVFIAEMIETIEAVEITLESHQEFSGEAEVAKIQTVQKLGEMLTAQLAAEAEAKRLQEERAELERLRAEQAERERAAALIRFAEEREAREAREREQAERLAQQAREDAERRAKVAAEEAELRKQREAEEAKLAEQRAEIARAQAEIDKQREEAARIERERLAAIEAEEQRKRDESEAVARAEAEKREAALRAEAIEKARRIREDFELNGPHASDMIEVLAAHYQVEQQTVLQWINRWVWAEVEVAA